MPISYVNSDFYESIGKNQSAYQRHVRIRDAVADDNIFLTREEWQAVEKKAVTQDLHSEEGFEQTDGYNAEIKWRGGGCASV